ncbi:hypothetical protein MMC14_006844 [Varicellaria rhodocarpa]|nr:hypothetical protein [Varicellaria rhodocarpa]
MDGPMPDPSTLDTEGDDDVPLNIVQEKAKLDRSSSRRNGSTPSQAPAPAKKPQQQTFDLMGDEIITPPVRPSTTDNPSVRPPPPKPAPATASQLLGGLDFLGGTPERPASASSKLANSTGPSRPDLKQSILSLYATAPRSQSQPQPQPSQQNSRQSSMGGTQSSAVPSSTAFGGLDDAFRGLDFSTSTSPPASQPVQQPQQPPKLSSFGSFGQISSQRTAPATPQLTSTPLSGGGFFDTGPKPPPKQTSSVRNAPPQSLRKISNASSGFGEFNSALNPTTASSIATSTNGLLDLSSPQSIASSKPANPSTNVSSVFNLSASKPASQYQTVTQSSAPPTQNTFSNLSNADAWGSNDAWSTPEPAAPASQVKSIKSPAMPPATQSDFGWGDVPSSNAPMPSLAKSPNMSSATTSDFGWANATSTNAGGFGMPSPPSNGFSTQAPNPSQKFDMSAPPTITADEDFGGWNSAAPETPVVSGVPPPLQTSPQPTKPANGFNASEDLWSNVWQ